MHQIEPEFQLGKAITIRSGHDATLICTGVMLELSVKVSEYLKEQDFSLQVISMPTVFPCDQYAIIKVV